MDPSDVLRLAGETLIDPRTIRRWAKGEAVSSATAYALRTAAVKLRIKQPTTTTEAPPEAAAGES